MKNFGNKESLSKKVGDKIERAGEKISDAGAHKLGRAVSNAGDKLEHSQDNKRKETFNKTTSRK